MTISCNTRLIACHDCDLLQSLPDGEHHRGKAYCARCGAVLHRYSRNSIDRSLALALTGLVLFLVSNLLPFLALNAQGRIQDSSLLSSSLSSGRRATPFSACWSSPPPFYFRSRRCWRFSTCCCR